MLETDPNCAHLKVSITSTAAFEALEEVPYAPIAPPNPELQDPEKEDKVLKGFPVNFSAPWLRQGCFSTKPPKTSVDAKHAWTVLPAYKVQGFSSTYHYHYVQEYLRVNGNRSHLAVPGDGDCMYSSIRRQLQAPAQYTNLYLRRQIACFMLEEHKLLYPLLKADIGVGYGVEGDDLGPFSYLQFCKKVSTLGFWGDQIVLKVLSIMWGVRVTVLLLPLCTEIRIRHRQPMAQADIVLVLSGCHYSSAGMELNQNCLLSMFYTILDFHSQLYVTALFKPTGADYSKKKKTAAGLKVVRKYPKNKDTFSEWTPPVLCLPVMGMYLGL